MAAQAEALRAEGASVVHRAVDGRLVGILAVSDPVKATMAEALATLRNAGIRVVMATGDGLTTARAAGQRQGIDEAHGEIQPADKLKRAESPQSESRVVAMAGDGINDAPALAHADVGIATATALSVATVANMTQNLAFAFFYDAPGIPIAAGLLHPSTGWLLSPRIAAPAMSLSSAWVVGNALRLRGAKIDAP